MDGDGGSRGDHFTPGASDGDILLRPKKVKDTLWADLHGQTDL